MAKLYKNFITKELKFSNREAMLAYMEGKGLNVEVEGCYVTNTSSYVDISLPTSELPDKLFEMSSILFVNTADYSDYIAIIDRIEPNNFNGQDGSEVLYYRLYITIDWWSTIMYNDVNGTAISNIKHYIEGGVARAHVDDYEIRGDEKYPTMKYTTIDQEYPISQYYNISERVVQEGQGSRKFVYIFSTSRPFPFVYSLLYPLTTPVVEIGSKKIRCGQYCCFGVLTDKDNDNPITLEYRVKTSEGVETKTVPLNYMYTADYLDDSDVVSLSCSDFNPFTTDDNHTYLMTEEEGVETSIYGDIPQDILDPVNFSTLFNVAEEEGDVGKDIGGIIMRSIKSRPIYSSSYNIITKSTYNFVPQTNFFDDYLASIPKQHFAPYTCVYIEKGDEKIILDTAYINNGNVLCDYVYVPWLGNYIIYAPTELNGGSESAYTAFCNNGNFERVSTSDEYTSAQLTSRRLGLIGSAIGLGGKAAAIGTLANPYAGAISAIGGVVGLAGNAMGLNAQESKTLKQGENGTKLIQGSTADFVSPLCVVVRKPDKVCMEALQRDLHLYGYTTYLHLHEVLVNHKRKVFNYIKATNANITLSSYSLHIRNAIEEMFNNGVWLWNTWRDFGNYEVVNYPIILEGNNV